MEWTNDLSVAFRVILYASGSLAALAAGVAVVVKIRKWLRKPGDDAMAGLSEYKAGVAAEHEEFRRIISAQQKSIDRAYELLAKDKAKLDAFEENQKVMTRALWAMLDHAITGNSDENMKKARAELLSHMINT